jgi:hypothetical protein
VRLDQMPSNHGPKRAPAAILSAPSPPTPGMVIQQGLVVWGVQGGKNALAEVQGAIRKIPSPRTLPGFVSGRGPDRRAWPRVLAAGSSWRARLPGPPER